MKFPEFNRVVNPNDEKCYVAFTSNSTPTALSFEEVTKNITKRSYTRDRLDHA